MRITGVWSPSTEPSIPIEDLKQMADELIGKPVKNEKGEIIGTIIAAWVDEKTIKWEATCNKEEGLGE